MPETHAARRDRLRAALAEPPADDLAGEPAEAALVTSLVNVRYLTGFTGSNAALLVTADGGVLATDGRYTAQAGRQAPDVELLIDRECAPALAARAAKDGGRPARLRGARRDRRDCTDGCADRAGETELVPLRHAVEQLRPVKDEDEIACSARRARSATGRWPSCCESILLGRTERRHRPGARAPDAGPRRRRARRSRRSWPAGRNSAIPHHRPTDRRVDAGDFLKIDFGARVPGLPRRHDPDLRGRGRAGRLAARDLRPGARGAAGRPGGARPGADVPGRGRRRPRR